MSVVDGGALDCSACYSPLKPPVFQCDVGHLLCSSCSEKMAGARRCHACRRVLDGAGYRPCYSVDRILGCLQVSCPNAGYGCSARLARHDQRAHLLQACRHGPCHCPAEACAFIRPVTALWDHFSAAHGWPCTTAVLTGGENSVHLRDGFSVVNLVFSC
ncbi:putative E3 ubiquitin-protein ligase SINA-like 6 [Aegilops tauschii subsp. strangulata]|nr:putative E3 ubiquitin-protein ligase SINA-like 6 [Aegilops tauschii subsp. strangulata]